MAVWKKRAGITNSVYSKSWILLTAHFGPVFILPSQWIISAVGGHFQVFEYNGEGNFGELALLYNMPRAATVQVDNWKNHFPTTSHCPFSHSCHALLFVVPVFTPNSISIKTSTLRCVTRPWLWLSFCIGNLCASNSCWWLKDENKLWIFKAVGWK